MENKILVMKLTTKTGKVFYNSDHSPDLIAAILKRCPYWKTIELIEMTTDEYRNIPSSNESAELFK